MKKYLLVVGLVFMLSSCKENAKSNTLIANAEELKAAISNAKPGDEILKMVFIRMLK